MRLLSKIGKKLRDQRIMLHLSQGEVAKKVGTNQGEISKIESGTCNVTVLTLNRMCKILELRLRINQRE